MFEVEARVRSSTGDYRAVLVRAAPLRDQGGTIAKWYGVSADIEDLRRATQALRASEEQLGLARAELARVSRVTMLGQLTAAIAHEVNQPIGATITNAEAALRWLGAQPPELEEVRQALNRIVKDGNRAGTVIGRIRALIQKAPPRKDPLEINGAIREVIELGRGDAVKNGVLVRTSLADGLPLIAGDRVLLQQVMLNLIINAVEAMSCGGAGARELLISTEKVEPADVLVAVRDSGPGFTPADGGRLFESFYTTKPNGLGLGLSICHSIVEAHGGRMWASPNAPRGAVFQFTLPARPRPGS
jgi:C4-dicarboxylate-specific signal transduction histidine kinase